jgi:hypothetical protein
MWRSACPIKGGARWATAVRTDRPNVLDNCRMPAASWLLRVFARLPQQQTARSFTTEDTEDTEGCATPPLCPPLFSVSSVVRCSCSCYSGRGAELRARRLALSPEQVLLLSAASGPVRFNRCHRDLRRCKNKKTRSFTTEDTEGTEDCIGVVLRVLCVLRGEMLLHLEERG